MLQSKIFLFFVLLAGVGVGAWVRDAISAAPSPAIESAESITALGSSANNVERPLGAPNNAPQDLSITELQQQLADSQNESLRLRAQLSELEDQVNQLLLEKDPMDMNVSQEMAVKNAMSRRGSGALTVESLVAAGIDERDAASMKSHLDDLAMQRLYLRDQATRDGSLGKKEYRNEMRRINEAQANLETRFGPNNYSRYLYAMGRPNKVDVQSVISNSPAYNAGLQTGDRIVSYDGATIYGANDVRRGTQRGELNQLVPVVVERDGQRLDLYVPRGPLGVQMTSESVRPTSGP